MHSIYVAADVRLLPRRARCQLSKLENMKQQLENLLTQASAKEYAASDGRPLYSLMLKKAPAASASKAPAASASKKQKLSKVSVPTFTPFSSEQLTEEMLEADGSLKSETLYLCCTATCCHRPTQPEYAKYEVRQVSRGSGSGSSSVADGRCHLNGTRTRGSLMPRPSVTISDGRPVCLMSASARLASLKTIVGKHHVKVHQITGVEWSQLILV